MANKRERIILAVTVGVIVLFLLDSLVMTPLMNATADLKLERDKLQSDWEGNENKIRRRRALAPSWSRWVRGSLKKDPSEAESQVINSVRAWARDSGAELIAFEPERPSQKGELREIRFQASAAGRYSDLIRFLYLFEASSIPLRIQRMDLRPIKSGNSEYLVIDLRFSTLYLVPESGEVSWSGSSRQGTRI